MPNWKKILNYPHLSIFLCHLVHVVIVKRNPAKGKEAMLAPGHWASANLSKQIIDSCFKHCFSFVFSLFLSI